MDEWMDRRMDGWMDGWMNGRMDGWMDGCRDWMIKFILYLDINFVHCNHSQTLYK